MAIKKIYKSRVGASSYVTRTGKHLHFIDGKHVTDVQEDIAELEHEISKSHPHIYVDPAEAEIDTTVQDRLAAAAQKAQLEELAKIAEEKKAASSTSDQSATVQTQTLSPASLLKVTSTADLGVLVAPSGT